MKLDRKLLLLAAVPALALSLFGCNTVEGAGKDIQAGGEAVESTAKKTKTAITE